LLIQIKKSENPIKPKTHKTQWVGLSLKKTPVFLNPDIVSDEQISLVGWVVV